MENNNKKQLTYGVKIMDVFFIKALIAEATWFAMQGNVDLSVFRFI